MATSRADLLVGDDYEGYEAFCDTLINYLKNNWYMSDPRTALTKAQDGMIAVDSDDGRVYYRHAGSWYLLDSEVLPKERGINLLINSGFGVWSQSDDNKGLGTLNFDSGSVEPQVGETLTGATSGAVGKVISVTVTGGTWGGGDAAGSIELGAVTGTFQDNENVDGSVGGANILTVDGDKTIGVANDPMNNDDTADWTTVDCTLNFDTDHYEIVRTAASQTIYINNVSFTEGKIYKIECDIKDGTEAGVEVKGYYHNGSTAATLGPSKVTAAGWASVSWTFEATETNAISRVGITCYIAGGGNNIEVRNFSCYEITPCCTEASNLAPDSWYKDATLDTYREHSGSNTKNGSFYALKLVPTAINDYFLWPTFGGKEWFYMKFRGRTVTFGAWVLTNTASHVRLRIADGVGTSYSSYHTGGGSYEWLEVSRVISASATYVNTQIFAEQSPSIDGSTIIYISQPMLVFSSIIGEGNYQFRDNEVIWLEEAITSNQLESYTGQGSQGPTIINLEADTEAMLPKGAKSIVVTSEVHDSASQNNDTLLKLSKSAAAQWVYYNDPSGKNNDKSNRVTGWQPLDEDGDYCFEIVASGAASFDVDEFRYHAVQVTS